MIVAGFKKDCDFKVQSFRDNFQTDSMTIQGVLWFASLSGFREASWVFRRAFEGISEGFQGVPVGLSGFQGFQQSFWEFPEALGAFKCFKIC